MSAVEFEAENKPGKQLSVTDVLLRVFDESVLKTDTGNSIIHAYLIKKNYPVSKPTLSNFTEAAAEGETSLEAIRAVIVHWPGNHTPHRYFQFQLKHCGNSWQSI